MTGWECPKCGKVYAPFVSTCESCGRSTGTVTFGGQGVATGGMIYATGTFRCVTCGQHPSLPPGTGCPIGSHYGTSGLEWK